MRVIYRKRDRLIVGTVPMVRGVATPAAETQEILNILCSDLGGQVTDYTVADAPACRAGEKYTVNADNTVSVVVDPALVKQMADRASATAKLLALGLTRAEIAAL